VPTLYEQETHLRLHHHVNTVRSRLRTEVSTGELIDASFPPESVTGEPKPRVLQEIEDLEPVRRGVYCGALAHTHPAPYPSLLRLPELGAGTAVVSASPECFLRRRGAVVETRPIKGTAATRATLRASAKDHAENVMIVDLARNDLGRVCEPGSIHVPTLCAVESHPGLHHLVSTVRGRLRTGVSTGALIDATFPPASVTGAPKPRVPQEIEDRQPVRRGVHCGAVGWSWRAPGDADLAVAIRTFTVFGTGGGGCTHLGVGGGIVADSQPDAEWRETELKASRLLRVAGADVPARVAS